MLWGLGTDLAPSRFCGFPSPAVRPFGNPVPSCGFKPPAWAPAHAALPGPRAAPEGSATFSWGLESGLRAPLGRGTTAPCVPLPEPRRGAMGGSPAGPSAGGQVLRRGGRPCKLCRAVTARWPLSAGRAAPAAPAEGGRGSPSAPSPPVGRRRPPGCLGSPRGFVPCGRRRCCLPGRRVAPLSGWSRSRLSLQAVAH